MNLAAVGAAVAQPVGGSVVAGQAQISTAGATTLINQSTSKAIINWQDFSVASGSTVQFAQPGASSITLNRVTGGSVSTINGSILANGQVWLLNSNGVLFGQGSSINVAGLLATTSDIANSDFLAGSYSFSGGGNGAVINNGTIQTARGGSAVLSAPKVVNKGLIKATAGHVVLAGTDTFTVDFNGDHLLSYAVGPSTQTGSVTNSGTIKAAGGQVLLTARAAAGVADGVINNTGMVEANSVRKGENGEIILDAGDGTAETSGSLDASGKAAGTTGGTVEVLGQAVAVTDGAKIDVSGDAGGGTALIGGNFHGAGPQANAQTTTVGKAVIKADAITSGNGGNVAIYSVGTTKVDASVSAQGGAQSGDGGQVETSGHYLNVGADALVLAGAPHGAGGNWLLDPASIDIVASGGNDDTGLPTVGFAQTPTAATIDASQLTTSLNNGYTITLQANNDITVNAAITGSTACSNSLILQASHSIILNAGITLTGSVGGLTLSAADPGGTTTLMTAPTITSAAGVTLSAANISLTNHNGDVGSSATPISVAGKLTLSATGNAYIQSTGSIAVTSANVGFTFGLASGGAITQTNAITAGALIVQDTGSGSITLANANNSIGALTLSTQSTPASVATTGALTLSNIAVGTSSFTLTTGGGITQIAPVAITANQVNLTAGGAIVLNNATNSFNSLIINTAGFAASVTDNVNVNLAGINLNVGYPGTPGSFALTASGKTVTQTGSLNVQDLTIGAGSITVTGGGNTVYGTARFTSTGDTNYYNGSGPAETVLGNSSIGGALTVNSFETIALSDTSGTVFVTGLASLTSNYGSISQTIPISAGSLTASITNSGGITLTDNGNAISGAASFAVPSSGGNGASFSNSLDTSIGASDIGNGNFTITSANSLAISGAVTVDNGDLFLAAVGPITQTAALTAEGMTAVTTGTGGITLTNANNAFSGLVQFNTASGSVIFANSIDTLLGNSAVAGDLDVEATGNGQTLELDGATGDTVTVGGLLTLHAGGNIAQLIPLEAGVGLNATSDTGMVNLSFDSGTAGNIVTGTVTSDGNDTVNGVVTLSGVGVVNFTNHAANTVLGSVNVLGDDSNTANISIEALDPYGSSGPHAHLYLNSNVTAQTTDGVNTITGDTILHSSGDIVNLGARSIINGDALILNSDFGNIGGSEPDGSSSNFMASNVNSMSLFLGTSVQGSGAGQSADISNAVSYIVGTDQGGIKAGAGSVLLGGGNGAIVTQHGNPGDQSSIDGSIVAGSLSLAPNGSYTLENPANVVGTFYSHTAGAGIFVNSASLILGQVDGNLFDNGNGMTPSGALTVSVVAGNITQTGDEMTIGGTTTLTAKSGNIILDGAANNITGSVTLQTAAYNAQTPLQGLLTFDNAAPLTHLLYAGGLNSNNAQVNASGINIHVTGNLSLQGNVQSATTASVTGDGGITEGYNGLITAPAVTLGATSGAIGSAGLLIQLESGSSSDLNLTVISAGQNAFLNLPVNGVSLSGVNLQGSAATPGNLTLQTAGNVSQTGSITLAGLNVSSSGGGIVLDNGGNAVSGTAQLATGSGSDATLYSSVGLTLGNNYVSQDLVVTSGGALTLAGSVNAGGNITLTAGTGISQSTGSSITQVANSDTQFIATATSGGINLSSPLNSIATAITLQAPGDISLGNVGETLISSIDNGADGNSYPIAANSVSLHVTPNGSGFGDIEPDFGYNPRGITALSISLSTAGGYLGGSEQYLTLSGGSQDTVAPSLSLSTAGGRAFLYAYSPVAIAGGSLGSGSLYLTAGGDIAINGPVNSLNGTISLDALGSIQVKAGVTADNPSSTSAGRISLVANNGCVIASDPCGTSSDTGGIFDFNNSLLSAGTMILNVEQGPDGISGGIGTGAAPLLINTYNQAGNPVSLSLGTYGGDVVISSAKGVSFDELSQGRSVDLRAPNVMDQTGNPIRGTLYLFAAGPITETYGITVGGLTLSTSLVSAPITMDDYGCPDCQVPDPGNTVTGVAHFDTMKGDATFYSQSTVQLGASGVNGNLNLGAFNSGNYNAQILIADPNGGAMHVTGSVSLSADTDIVQGQSYKSGVLDATNAIALQTGALDIENGGAVTLTSSANKITGAITLDTNSDPTVFNSVNTILGTTSVLGDINVQSGGSLTVTGPVVADYGKITLAANGGNLTLAPAANIFSFYETGNTIILAASGNFINNASSGGQVLSPGAGDTWKIYSAAPTGDVFGGLNSNNTAVWDTAYPAAVTQTGDRYVFALQPDITVTSGSLSKIYGTDVSASLPGNYTISGVQPGVANAFLGDTAASVYSGTPAIGSTGAAPSAGAGAYAITPTAGSLAVRDGYGLAFVNGSLTVSPATLAYAANSASRNYGAVDPVYTGTVTGFVNGDTQAGATTGTLAFATTATAGSGVGTYTINGGGLMAKNYVFTQASSNATALTINPAVLTYSATAVTRLYGQTNAAFSGLVSGFVNGDTQASATTGTLAFASLATAASNVGSYAINGSGLLATNYTFAQAATNATALTINPATLTYLATAASRIYGQANPALSGMVGGFVNGDTQASATSGMLAFTSPATQASNVGLYAINGSGLLATNYIFAQAAANAAALTITPAALTIALTGTVSKTYDGTTAATLSASNYTALSGILGTDAVALSAYPTAGLYDTAAVGTGKTVTVAGLTLTGAKAADYTIPGSVSGAIGVIANSAFTATSPILAGFTAVYSAPSQSSAPPQAPEQAPTPPFLFAALAAAQTSGTLSPGILAELAVLSGPSLPGNDDLSVADQTTNFEADSLSGSSSGGGGGTIIPHLLNAHNSVPAAPIRPGDLPSWGNAGLWN